MLQKYFPVMPPPPTDDPPPPPGIPIDFGLILLLMVGVFYGFYLVIKKGKI